MIVSKPKSKQLLQPITCTKDANYSMKEQILVTGVNAKIDWFWFNF